jgi:hypothetical protein
VPRVPSLAPSPDAATRDIAEEGWFGSAPARLGYPQSTMSQRIARAW